MVKKSMIPKMPKMPKMGKVSFKFSTWQVIGLLVVAAIIGWLYMHSFSPSAAIKKLENFVDKEDFNHDGVHNCENTSKKYSLMFFHMESCPHCIEFKPTWESFLSEMDKAEYKDMKSKLCITDISSNNNDLLEKYNVSSFPTLLFIKDTEKPKSFDDARTLENLIAFVKRNVA